MDEERVFYTVWNTAGNTPKVPHSDLELALAEAERLAAKHNGTTFYVMKSICFSVTAFPPVETKFLCSDG